MLLEELINRFYDENRFLRDELTVTFNKEQMLEIVKEVTELKLRSYKW